MQLTDYENAIAGHDLTDNDRTIRALVWYVITPGAIAGTAVILWAVWQVIQWIAS